MAFETEEAGKRDNTHSLYEAKFRKVLCFHKDDQVNKEARKELAVLRAPRRWEEGRRYLCLSPAVQ